MTVIFNFENIANIIVIVVGAFLGIHFLFLKEGNRKANILFSTYLLFVSINVLAYFLKIHFPDNIYVRVLYALLSPFFWSLILLYYSFSLTNTLSIKYKKYLWLFIPIVVDIVSYFIIKIFHLSDDTTAILALEILSYPYNLFIYFLILKETIEHNRNIQKIFSSIENKQLNWFKTLMIFNIIFISFCFLRKLLIVYEVDSFFVDEMTWISSFITLTNILWIGFSGLRQAPIFDSYDNENVLDIYQESGNYIQKENMEEVLVPFIDLSAPYKEITGTIEKQQLYLDNNLSLKTLSDKLQIRDKELSKIINQCYNDNFYHYINSFRINYFKEIINDEKYKNMTLEAIAFEAGFNSKSSFYSAFKKMENSTPQQYINSLKSAIQTK